VPADDEKDFASGFARWAKRVRAHHAARFLITGITAGWIVGALLAAAAWWSRDAGLRVHAWWLGACGLLIGAWLARRRRWSDQNVALFLDSQLDSKEAIVTALELRTGDKHEHAAYRTVLREASTAIATPARREHMPAAFARGHLFAPLAAAAIAAIGLAPLPPAPPAPAPPPGSEIVKLSDLGGLDEVIRLSAIDPEDEAQAKRLRELSRRARALREKLQEGMPKREALDEIAKLRDAVAHERQRLGTGEERDGLESAVSQLRKNPHLDKARKALGDRDLTALDKEMQRLANQLEQQDRQRALEALAKATEAARKRGAAGVARALEEQRRRLAAAGAQSDKLRALADAMKDGLSDEAKRALEQMTGSGDPEAARKLAEALSKALEQLSDEERKRLAERMKERAAQLDPEGTDSRSMSDEQLREMARKLATKEGQQQLLEQLRQQAKPETPSERARRQQQLRDAERGLGQTQSQCQGGAPLPLGGGQPSAGGQASAGAKAGGPPGISRGGGPGNHDGRTDRVESGDLRSHARAPLSPGAPNAGSVQGRTPGRAGETANHRGQGELGRVGPSQVGAVERSDVPKEYREQVGRYFQP
jgi:hypothetical protein